ncbi:lantibiotic dehydratase [Dyadobacter sp. CY261]|uniref:lantibiotic dehydratase n=1 Tax=Dyadobacter sp. CY261 TaxID=2907203 RepID=UPI001F31BC2F|nr:lantibiotic dehydratase [Dyadobacter sp. CY261]MCF0072989.1 lantibiotic dehydratase [Dyadobacter sp. CY261]
MSILSQGFFVLRRPLLSLNAFHGFNERVNNNPEMFEAELIRFFSQPAMLEAIYLASPELYSTFTGLIEGRVKTGVEKLLMTLYKYLVRMTSRSTPYGMFAGCAIGEIGESTSIEFDTNAPFYTHSRLDMNYVAEMAEGLLKKETIRGRLKFSPNSSLYRIGDTYRYVESSLNNKKRFYTLTSVNANTYLDCILLTARHGATVGELAESIVSGDISRQEASRYVDQIIDAQILTSELAATVTGDEFFETIIARLNGLEGAEEDVARLNTIADLLQSTEAGVCRYKKIESVITRHFAAAGSKDLIQTDLFYNTRACTISQRAIGTLMKEYKKIEFLGYRNPQPDMELFKKRFLDRYEQREMPLLAVLDSETGIGYGDAIQGGSDNLPLLDDVQFPEAAKVNAKETSVLTSFREGLYQRAMLEGTMSVCLTDAMLDEVRKSTIRDGETPDSFYLFGNLIATSQQDVDNGNFKFAFNAMGGPSGLKLVGRFCHGSEQLSEWVQNAVREEESCREDVVFAEIAHLPEARVGNVLMRPHFRKYEIPYMAASSMPEENRIMPQDLMVSVSLSGEVILRSKRLNKRVFPRLTNAHNFANGLPVYRFLCELTYQDNYQYLGWNWEHLSASVFLPRIEYKHWVLSKATWNIGTEMFVSLAGKHSVTAREWSVVRKAYNIPRFVQLRQGDNEFLIDGESDFSVQVLCDSIRKFGHASLTEFLEGDENGLLQAHGNRYVNEVLIPFLHRKEPSLTKQSLKKQPAIPLPEMTKRNFIAGSEWLYVKIYAGTKTADRLLTSVIKPLADRLIAGGVIEKWFFVRYHDPNHHIRLRFYNGTRLWFWHAVLMELNTLIDPLLAEGTVHKIQIDTYKRELERYGDYQYEEVESIFFADSQATAGFLNMLNGDEGERYRWLIGMRATDMLLTDLGFGPEEKKKLVTHLQENFFREFRGDTQLSIQLNNKYRAHSDAIQSFLDPRQDAANNITGAIRPFRERSARIKNSMKILAPAMEISVGDLAVSLIHMFINRLFVSRQREHELVIYHYLKKYYDFRLAKRRKLLVATLSSGNN